MVENVAHQSFTNYAKKHLFNSNDIVIEDEYPYKNTLEMAISFNSNYVADPFKFEIPFLFAGNARGLYDWVKRLEKNELISQRSKIYLGKTANILSDKSMQSPFGKVRICEEAISGSTRIVEHTHDGSLGNFKCIARRFNDGDLTIIILTNQNNNNVYPISESIYNIVTEKMKKRTKRFDGSK